MTSSTPTQGSAPAEVTHFWGKPDEEAWYPQPRGGDSPVDVDASVAAVPGLATEPADITTALGRYLATLATPEPEPPIWERLSSRARLTLTAAVVVLIAVSVTIIATRSGSARRVDPAAAYLTGVRAGATGSVMRSAPDAAVVGLGRGVCDKLGASPPPVVERSMLDGARGKDFPVADAVVVIRAAAAHLCPAHAADVGGWDGTPAPQP